MSQKDHKQSAAAAGEHARGALNEGAATIEQLVGAAADYLTPKVKDARERVVPLVSDAYEKITPHLANAQEKVAPYVEKTKGKVTESYESLAPRIQELLDKPADSDYAAKAAKLADSASTGAQTAASKIAGNAQGTTLKAAAATKATTKKGRKAKKAAKRAAKAAAAAQLTRGVTKTKKKKHRGRNRFFTILGVLAVVGALVMAVRQLLMPRDDGWTPREPSNDFDDDDVTTQFSGDRVDHLTSPATDQTSAEAQVHETPDSSAHGEDRDAPVISEDAHIASSAEPRPADEAERGPETPAEPDASGAGAVPPTEPDVETTAAQTLDEAEEVWAGEGGQVHGTGEPKDFGPDSYVGENPPEGFTIKGNQRSMKYHTPDGAGFARTNADVWFSSEEAAEAAGFTKASR
ncbi:hypothetical protein SAMN05443377_10160 [Propionibacterium cyclohexanicum]|uniref:Uncharacterized protein n=1 Tax=Propionibacterium cyclohexanicum TaxID=64702 RepID=A0A1H9PJ71_9ACTN|nr:hypothetical protein [Propionibacterium cyclohexanicum]SER47895.1 hypothetical protein SAMN05443377_10160 [Propionibacterium cyclohexanicum]